MVKNRKELPLLKVLLAFLVAILLFSSGLLIGYSVSYFKFQDIYRSQESIRYNILSADLEKNFIASCNPDVFSTISSELDEMGNVIDILEERFGKQDAQVIEQKKRYTLLEVQHFLTMKDYSKQCSNEINLVIFFYSNSDLYKNQAEKIGYILNSIKKDNPDKIMIYSFDYDLDISIMRILKNVYNVSSPNVVVINEKDKITDISNKEEIEKYL